MNLLLIEDSQIDILNFENILLKYYPNITISKTDNIETALQIVENNKFDVIMTDIYLKDGTVDKNILNSLAISDIPILVTSGKINFDVAANFGNHSNIFYIDKNDINQRTLPSILNHQLKNNKETKDIKINSHLLQRKVDFLDLFANTIGHDLKNPLNSIIGLSDYISSEENVEKKELVEAITMIKSSALDINQTLNDLLEYVKLSYSEMHNDTISLSNEIQYIRHKIQGQFQESPFKFTASGDSIINLPKIAITTIFTNLITNSIKYKEQDRDLEINVRIKDTHDSIIVEYSDNAKGFHEINKGDLFTAFKRLDSSKEVEGHGLGMALVAKSVELCHGDIDYHTTPGIGTTFFIKFYKIVFN